MRIKQEYLDQVNDSNLVKADLIKENDVHPFTVQRWIKENAKCLTNAQNLAIICSHLGKTQDEILEVETVKA